MARIAGVNIPTAKRVPIALTYITGIGNATAKSICDAVGIDQSRRVNELSDSEVLQIREFIDANLSVEGDLRLCTVHQRVDRGALSRSLDGAARRPTREDRGGRTLRDSDRVERRPQLGDLHLPPSAGDGVVRISRQLSRGRP